MRDLVVAALKTDEGKQANLSPVKFMVMDLSDVKVTREEWVEKRRCDLVIQKNGFLCIIENKVGANEGPDQTKDYYESSLKIFPKEQYPHRIYIYLSPFGDPPKDEHFIAASYQVLLDVLKDLQDDSQTSETEMFLLRQFQENLRRSIAMDRETLELTQEIYRMHGAIIDFIYKTYKNAERPEAVSPETAWDGKSWFFNIGEVGQNPYSWEDDKKHSFICAGGGSRYRQIMQDFKIGEVIYAYVSGRGYVGIGTVVKRAMPFHDATLEDGKTKLSELYRAGKLTGNYNGNEDVDREDWIVLVKWEKVVDKNHAVRLSPIVPSTASRILNHRKDLVEKVTHGLGLEK